MVHINDKSLEQTLRRHLDNAQKAGADSTEKLASGTVFTKYDPRPADRAIAEGLEYRVRSLAASKRNINDAVSLVQTADSAMSQINDMVLRMKEINIAATNTTIDDRERRFLFVEYQALYDEVQRVSESTEFNGVPLLNGEDERVPDKLVFRLDDPFYSNSAENEEGDINVITFQDLRRMSSTPKSLGLQSALDLLADSNADEGISIEDATELMLPENEDVFSTIYDEAVNSLAEMRSTYGSMHTRMERAIDFNEVFSENLSAARSHIADTDYAEELSRLTSSRILQQAGTAVLAQTNFAGQLTATLLHSLL